MLSRQPDLEVLTVKDYIAAPKPNGYRSLHVIVQVPVFLSQHTEYVPVELQLRTIAMDFRASTEHKLSYKYEKNLPASLRAEAIRPFDAFDSCVLLAMAPVRQASTSCSPIAGETGSSSAGGRSVRRGAIIAPVRGDPDPIERPSPPQRRPARYDRPASPSEPLPRGTPPGRRARPPRR